MELNRQLFIEYVIIPQFNIRRTAACSTFDLSMVCIHAGNPAEPTDHIPD